MFISFPYFPSSRVFPSSRGVGFVPSLSSALSYSTNFGSSFSAPIPVTYFLRHNPQQTVMRTSGCFVGGISGVRGCVG